MEFLVTSVWLHYFKKPLDTIEGHWSDCLQTIRDYFFNAAWFEVYDFVEFIAGHGPSKSKETFLKACNGYLERENAAYRFVNGSLAEITSQGEIDEVESAITKSEPYPGVKTHLVTALAHMSNKTHPDYRNSIKESISAVESLAKAITKSDSATLGVALKTLEKSKKLHPALKSAFSSLYGYTSDADGIRHALLDEPELSKTDARFMLICCSAFINYAIDSSK